MNTVREKPAATSNQLSQEMVTFGDSVLDAYSIQALTLAPTGALGLTMATPFCVGWEHGRVP
jgi:hypothetical protein